MNTKLNQNSFPLSLSSCATLLAELEGVKNAVTNEFGEKLREYEPMLRLALTEAESLAFQTPYPHLFFPTLAEEKAKGLLRWALRQQRLQSQSLVAA